MTVMPRVAYARGLRRERWAIKAVATLAILTAWGCRDDASPVLEPAADVHQSQVLTLGGYSLPLAKIADVPALEEIDMPKRARPWDGDPDALRTALEQSSGAAAVAIKSPGEGRSLSPALITSRRAAVPAEDVLAGLEVLVMAGVTIERYSTNLGVVHVVMSPELGPLLTQHPRIDWIEPKIRSGNALHGFRPRARRAPAFFAETRPWGIDGQVPICV